MVTSIASYQRISLFNMRHDKVLPHLSVKKLVFIYLYLLVTWSVTIYTKVLFTFLRPSIHPSIKIIQGFHMVVFPNQVFYYPIETGRKKILTVIEFEKKD